MVAIIQKIARKIFLKLRIVVEMPAVNIVVLAICTVLGWMLPFRNESTWERYEDSFLPHLQCHCAQRNVHFG